MASESPEPKPRQHSTAHKHGGLKELPATAICGNDITSSCLHVSALAIIAGGKWAWLSLLIVAVLFLFRSIYAEVVGALPLSGAVLTSFVGVTGLVRASRHCCSPVQNTMLMMGRIWVLKVCLFFVRNISESIAGVTNAISTAIRSKMDEINSQQVVFFTRGDSIHNLNEAMLYVRNNEHTNRLKVVTLVDDEKDVPARLAKDLKFLDEAHPDIDIEFVVQKGEFGPKLIKQISKEWNIPANFMFIASPGDHFLYGLAELGGVRLII